jgi:antitoxin component of MazEF toxin-antitoxin module
MVKMESEFETITGKVWKTGGSYVVTIPTHLVRYGGYEINDIVKFMIKRMGYKAKDKVIKEMK